jgi:hypothetical protein
MKRNMRDLDRKFPIAGTYMGSRSTARHGTKPGCRLWHGKGGTLSFTLSATPDQSWVQATTLPPPSYGQGEAPAIGHGHPNGRN